MPREHVKYYGPFFALMKPPGRKRNRILSFKTKKGRDLFVEKAVNAKAKAKALTKNEARVLLTKMQESGDTRTTTSEGLFLSHAHYLI